MPSKMPLSRGLLRSKFEYIQAVYLILVNCNLYQFWSDNSDPIILFFVSIIKINY